MNSFGVLLIDKPIQMTSFEVIKQLRRVTEIRKIGHAGTLDPFASGLLPVCVGKATRIIDRLMNREKEYLVKMKLGVCTQTGDPESEIIKQQNPEEISAAELANLKKQILELKMQVPHKFSAVKINGKRAYELARKNQQFELPARPIKIHSFEIIEYHHPILVYRVVVSKGTYIRSLSETIAEMLGTIGMTLELSRTAIGEMKVSEAVALEELQPENWQEFIIPLEKIFSKFPSVKISEIEHFKNGRKLAVDHEDSNDVAVFSNTGRLVGFGVVKASALQPRQVLI